MPILPVNQRSSEMDGTLQSVEIVQLRTTTNVSTITVVFLFVCMIGFE